MIEKQIKIYKDFRKKILSYQYALYVIGFDSETLLTGGSFEGRSGHVGILSQELYDLSVNKEYVESIYYLSDNEKELDKDLAFEVKRERREIDKLKKVPSKEYVDYQILLSKSQNVWGMAKNKNDFSLVEECLTEIVAYNRKYVKWQETDNLKGYDVLLDEYEKDYTTKEYDVFFGLLKEKLVPFINEVTKIKKDFIDLSNKTFDISGQKEFSKYIENVMCYDKNYGTFSESEHPFTSGFGPEEVRYTNHYHENDLHSGIFSAIHELGHCTYELQVDHKFVGTYLTGGASMAMHESQSRFYENIIGRSYEFWRNRYKTLQMFFFDDLKNFNAKEFYLSCNRVEKSLIRTEADELTYPIHIMIRYDLEKKLIGGTLEVKDLPKAWNQKVKDYLGLDVPSDKLGCLQDVHWYGGSIGYFPTYALGSAYSSQIFNSMNKDFDVLKDIRTNATTKNINIWLKENIHKYGSSMIPKDIIKKATKEEFNPKYYIDYLIEKYTKIYEL